MFTMDIKQQHNNNKSFLLELGATIMTCLLKNDLKPSANSKYSNQPGHPLRQISVFSFCILDTVDSRYLKVEGTL